jgi:transcriptional regulator with XRE-family HTH domain
MSMLDDDHWPRQLRAFRSGQGLSQVALAEMLGVNQKTVSRWERGEDMPGMAMRRVLRDLICRRNGAGRDRALTMRVRNSCWPQTILTRGAVFIEANAAALAEAGLPHEDLRGHSIYGRFGDETDVVTARWEREGFFQGEFAMCITLNFERLPDGGVNWLRTLDTPYFTGDGDIWCLSELKRLSEQEYGELYRQYGGPFLRVPF